MFADNIQDSYPYRSTVTQVEVKSLILVSMVIDVLLQIFSSFKKIVHASAFRLVMSMVKDSIYMSVICIFDVLQPMARDDVTDGGCI